MRAERLVARYLGVGMIPFHHVIIHDDGEGTSYDPVIHQRHDLSLGKYPYQRLDLLAGPENILVGVYPLERLRQLRIVLKLQTSGSTLFILCIGSITHFLLKSREVRINTDKVYRPSCPI